MDRHPFCDEYALDGLAQTLYLLRGIPGAGKSTLAGLIAQGWNRGLPAGPRCLAVVLEADDYFVDEDGVYRYRAEELAQAHARCQADTDRALGEGLTVLVANTFIKAWEADPYQRLARTHRVPLVVIDLVNSAFGNRHLVPDDKVRAMAAAFEAAHPAGDYLPRPGARARQLGMGEDRAADRTVRLWGEDQLRCDQQQGLSRGRYNL